MVSVFRPTGDADPGARKSGQRDEQEHEKSESLFFLVSGLGREKRTLFDCFLRVFYSRRGSSRVSNDKVNEKAKGKCRLFMDGLGTKKMGWTDSVLCETGGVRHTLEYAPR